MVSLKISQYLFETPIPKTELIQDQGLSESLIIRMPSAGNPIELTPRQWQAILRRVDARAHVGLAELKANNLTTERKGS